VVPCPLCRTVAQLHQHLVDFSCTLCGSTGEVADDIPLRHRLRLPPLDGSRKFECYMKFVQGHEYRSWFYEAKQ